jgi:uncharacterized protein (TIGR03437 family)
VLTVTYNGQIASATFPASAASPGIFVDSTGAPAGAQTAARGQTIAIYVTGTGGLSPQPDAGSLPDSGTTPVPTSNVVVSVAGINVNAAQPYVYEGVPAWAIGLIQINFTVPANTPLGPQPVVVAVGSSFSATATVLITK